MAAAKLVIAGQGYVGLPVAMRAVAVGYNVVGVDPDVARIDRLRRGDSYVEQVSDATLQAALRTGRYAPTTSYAAADGFDFAVITVPTPLHDRAPDLRPVESACRSLAGALRRAATVILESTTYPGTTDGMVRDLLEAGSGLAAGTDFHLGYSPERIDPGNPQWSFTNTPKVVSGINAASLRAVRGFYDTLVVQTVPVSGTREAETAKLLENTFRHVNIALVNELATFTHDLGINLQESIAAAATKPFGFMRFDPGPGVGGHCLPIDPSYLSWELERSTGRPVRFVELANDINSRMPDYVVGRIDAALHQCGKALRDAQILLVGLSYKKNSADCRNSPALRVADLLHAAGATVSATDHHVQPAQIPDYISLIELDELAAKRADIVVVLTDHDDVDYPALASAPLLFNARSGSRDLPGAEQL